MADSDPIENGTNGHDDLPKAIVLASETLRGDVRDEILREFKAMAKPWAQMNEKEQERVIHRSADIADNLVMGALRLTAHKGNPHVVVQVSQFTVKDDVKVTLSVAAILDNIVKLASAGAHAVLVLADPKQFSGEKKKPETDVVGDLAMPKQPEAQGDLVVAAENAANLAKLEKTLKANNAAAEAAAH